LKGLLKHGVIGKHGAAKWSGMGTKKVTICTAPKAWKSITRAISDMGFEYAKKIIVKAPPKPINIGSETCRAQSKMIKIIS
jgi:hypothetical protein